MNIKLKMISICCSLHVTLMVCIAAISFFIYKVSKKFTGEESLFIAGVISAFVLCSFVAKKWPEESIKVCFWATFLASSILGGASMYLANIFETFLTHVAFYVICLVGVISAMLVRESS